MAVRQAQTEIVVAAEGQGLHEFTAEVRDWVRSVTAGDGLLTLFVRHTSASLLIQENADPDVQADLVDFFRAIAREEPSLYRHVTEGPDDMPAHIRAALTQTQLCRSRCAPASRCSAPGRASTCSSTARSPSGGASRRISSTTETAGCRSGR